MTFEKDNEIVEIKLRTWAMQFQDGTEAKMSWLQDVKNKMDKLQFIEAKWYRQVLFDAPCLEFAYLSLS